MRFLFLVLFLVCSYSFGKSNFDRVQELKSVSRIAFGSCNDQNDPQPLWKDVLAQNPDLWIWGGDNIYADWNKSTVQLSYGIQNQHPDYAELKSRVPMIGTWDDHDYGYDNADGTYPNKIESQRHFFDFFDEPFNSPRREREGIYHSWTIGEANQKIKFIMLDNRYFKGLDPQYYMLGKTQWEWLENEFKNSEADLHIIMSGLSIFSPQLPVTEEWADRPQEMNRMLEIIKKHKVKAPLFLTGDKHFSTIFRRHGQLEFLSSGMTHTAPRKTWWLLGKKYPVTYFGISYGLIDVSWEKSIPSLKLRIRNGQKDIHPTNVTWENGRWVNL